MKGLVVTAIIVIGFCWVIVGTSMNCNDARAATVSQADAKKIMTESLDDAFAIWLSKMDSKEFRGRWPTFNKDTGRCITLMAIALYESRMEKNDE